MMNTQVRHRNAVMNTHAHTHHSLTRRPIVRVVVPIYVPHHAHHLGNVGYRCRVQGVGYRVWGVGFD
jgi:hypothetical protein